MPETTHEHHSVKETAISILIAFSMAFIFRGFVVEAFLIPTGSMAPTLLGAHMEFRDDETGYTWAVGPWHYASADRPYSIQAPTQLGGRRDGVGHDIRPINVGAPMTGRRLERSNIRTRAGDRIFVFKYLYSIFEPQRFDVIVFKNPTDPKMNFIKRLVGLPGEQIALVDGDVYWRDPARHTDIAGAPLWSQPGWRIARKPERAQREVWQPVFDSRYAPTSPESLFRSPWRGGLGWDTRGRDYRFDGSGATTLEWQTRARRTTGATRVVPPHALTWDVNDFYPYNEIGSSPGPRLLFPVSDVAMGFGIEPDAVGMTISAVLVAERHELRADIGPDRVVLRMRPASDPSAPDQPGWTILADEPLARTINPGRVTNVEFWHVDQSLQVWIDGRRVAAGYYDWSPAERIENAMGATLEQIILRDNAGRNAYLTNGANYIRPSLRWEFDSPGPFTLHRVSLARDVYYQAIRYPGARHSRRGDPGAATHPEINTVHLDADQFFVCGDNSPSSADGRLWDKPDPWIAELIDPEIGIVNRKLLIGKAFFVYFPAAHRLMNRSIIPDFGSMRFIW